MTSLAYGLDMPYEVQLEHSADPSNNHMIILEPQRSPDFPVTRHRLNPGVYMVSLSYNGAAGATLHHVGAGPDNKAPVPAGTAGVPRTSAPMKISVQHGTEYLYVVAPGTGGSARATISVIPTSTFDDMAESAQGVAVLSDLSNLKTTLDARVPADTSLRLDTSVGTRIFAGDTMIHGDTGWRDIGATGSATWDFSGHVRYGIHIRRIGNRVTLWMAGVYDTSTGDRLFTVPDRFRSHMDPFGLTYSGIGVVRVGSTQYQIGSYANGRDYYIFGGHPSSGSLVAELTWHTDEPWPTTLPGLPA